LRRALSLALVILLVCGFTPFSAPPAAQANAAMAAPGTRDNPFLVSTGNHLAAIGTISFPANAHYRQIADIDLSAQPWAIALTTFTGTFDGGGYKITGMNLTGTHSDRGLFGTIGQGGVVKNVGLENVNINLTGTSNFIGGIAARNHGTIRNSYVTGSIAGRWYVGGIAGTNDGVIENCYARVTINAADYAGGLAGATSASGTIRNSVALNPSITSSDTPNTRFAGRVSGNNHGTLANNFALDTMTVTMDGNAKTLTKGLNTIDGADITATRGAARIAGIGRTAEWSILWLIIPELNATVGGTLRQSTLPAASATRLRDLAATFKTDTEREIMALNGLDLTLNITTAISNIPIRSVTGHYPALGHWPTAGDIAPILDVHAPNREGDFDSLIVMAQFPQELHSYGGLNGGWMSFCPLPYTYDYKTGQGRHYDVQLHEWVHQMEGIGNRILTGSQVPSPDDLNEQNPEYTAHLGDRLNTVGLNSFYWEILAGTLPAKTGRTGGFNMDWWAARPTLSAPKFAVDFTDGVTATITYSYDVQVNDSFMLIPQGGGGHEITRDRISVSNDKRVITVSLGELADGRYTLNSTGYGYSLSAPGSFFNPNFERSFTVGASGPGNGNDGGTNAEPAPAVIVSSTSADTATINLTAETITLPENFTVAGFSIDGGGKWRKGALPAPDRFPRMLNRGMTLWITSAVDDKNRPVYDEGVAAATIKFPEIGARPKRNADRLAPFYGDISWGLAPRNSTVWSAVVTQNLEFAPSSNGRAPDDGQWFQMPQGGIPIVEGSARPSFLVRTAPNAATAASVAWRVRPANFGKAPNYSIRQVKEGDARIPVIALRRGDQYAVGAANASVITFAAALTDRATLPAAQLREQGEALYVRRAATGRRPPSLIQTIPLPAPQ
jgi:hypothetical protein